MPPVYGHRIIFAVRVSYRGPHDLVLDDIAQSMLPANVSPIWSSVDLERNEITFSCRKVETIRDKLFGRPDEIIGT